MRTYPLLLLAVVTSTARHPTPRPPKAPPTPAQLTELWVEPEPGRDLLWGVGGRRLQPEPSATYKILDTKRAGFSMGFTAQDPGGRQWSVKLPPEAPTEVVASRILWGVGYHQPPIYYVGRWNAEGSDDPNPQLPGRFRENKPALHGLDAGKSWSYYHGPFVGTRPMNALLVLMAMLDNSDLKDEQNVVYRLSSPFEGASRWYVARDLGQSFGRTGVIDAPRGDAAVFDETPFITGLDGHYVRFDWHGRHGVLLERITPEDVHWISARLQRLTDRQWQDAFRAGGYAAPVAARFIRRFKQKIEEGLAVGR
ncbi:MAG TPA: hypothetical protein VGI12_06350 [Vicinamibacterales bacterium]|jgi:hypothetical protein